MTAPGLLHDVSGADWVAARLLPRRIPHGVPIGAVVPTGYSSVVRVPHPAGGRTWAQVAASTGRTVHALAQWCGISPHFTGASRSSDVDPEEGSVPMATTTGSRRARSATRPTSAGPATPSIPARLAHARPLRPGGAVAQCRCASASARSSSTAFAASSAP